MKKDKLSNQFKSQNKKVSDLKVGEFGYTTYWQLTYNSEGIMCINGNQTLEEENKGTLSIKIGRGYLGYYADFGNVDNFGKKYQFQPLSQSDKDLIEITYLQKTPTLADEILAANTIEDAKLLAKLISNK